MKKIVFVVTAVISVGARAQDCNCDHIISGLSNTSVNIINASSYTYAPGDIFCIQADSIAGIRFIGFEGSATDPLIFINCGGQVVIDEPNYSGIAFNNSKFVQVTGSGYNASVYGFKVIGTGSGQMGVALGYLCSDFEVDHIEIANAGFAGIMAKTDPNCTDTLTWRSSGYVFYNLSIHHNYIHESGGEGMYIGNTSGYKVQSTLQCSGEYVFAHWFENVDIHHNILENTGWDAIQLNLVQNNGKIHDNVITNWGTEGELYQDFIMSVGGGVYEIYNNYALNLPGNPGKGMQMISGQSGSKLYNNVFINPNSNGIFLHARHEFDDTTEGYYLVNNTIINPGLSGIMYNSGITLSEDPGMVGNLQNQVPTYFVNNFITSPGTDYGSGPTWKDEQECYFDFNAQTTRNAQISHIYSNMMTRQLDTIGLADTLNHNYKPADEFSKLVNAGSDVAAFGVSFDHENVNRPLQGAFDIGAYELSAFSFLDENFDGIQVYPNPFSEIVYLNNLPALAVCELYNATGQLIFSEQIHADFMQIDLEKLEQGFYFVVIKTNNQVAFQTKLVKIDP